MRSFSFLFFCLGVSLSFFIVTSSDAATLCPGTFDGAVSSIGCGDECVGFDDTSGETSWNLYGCPPGYPGDWRYDPNGTVWWYGTTTQVQKYTKVGGGYWDRTTYDLLGGDDKCVAPEPTYCSNGVMDEDETGIDCGGSCGECLPYCNDGMYPYFVSGLGTMCGYRVDPNEFGDCPSGYVSTDGFCYEVAGSTDITFASSDYDSPTAPDDPNDNPYNEKTASTSLSIVKTSDVNSEGEDVDTEVRTKSGTDKDGKEFTEITTIQTVNHLDGSKTVTTTINNNWNGTEGDDSGSSGSTSVAEYDPDGNLVSEEVTESEENTDPNPDGLDSPNLDDHQIDWQPLLDAKDNLAGRFPISVLTTIKDSLLSFKSDESSIPKWTVKIWNHDMVIDPSFMAPVADYCRNFLEFLIGIFVAFKIYRRWI